LPAAGSRVLLREQGVSGYHMWLDGARTGAEINHPL
jgi:hypothetical protein